jgi:NADH-quinone oxidoreductase subunit A
MGQYLPVVALMVLAIVFGALSFVGSRILAPRRPSTAKDAPYECGIVPEKEPAERFPVKFYLVAMIFIIFDIEIIFLYPWAVMFNQLGTFALIEMVLFSVAVIVSFIYLISNGALDWGPVAKLKQFEEIVGNARTSASTVRKVSRPTTEVVANSAGEAA